MKTPTYEEQWQKITSEYMENKIQPYNQKFCFCGNLCNNTTDWYNLINPSRHNSSHGYSGQELVKMEKALLNTISKELNLNFLDQWCDEMGFFRSPEDHPNYETALFNGMVAALEVLCQIHAERGDVTAIEIPLVKRELQTI